MAKSNGKANGTRLPVAHELILRDVGAAISRAPWASVIAYADFDDTQESVIVVDPAAPTSGPCAARARLVRVVRAELVITTYADPDYEDDVEVVISYLPLTKSGEPDARVREPRTHTWAAKGQDPEQFRAIIDAIGTKLDGGDPTEVPALAGAQG